jgi:hypothetical protein
MDSRRFRLLACAIVGAAGTLATQAPAFAGDVSVSVNLAAPGLYGQINIGGEVPAPPAPELLLPRPVVAVPVAVAPGAPPPPALYLHVPPGHERHWARHCHEYNACGRPVYFVSDRWYNEVYTPRWREHEHAREDWRRHEAHERYEEHERRHEEHDRDHHDHGHDHDHDHR